MKKIIISALLLIWSVGTSAQQLTKDQTIAYILEKLKETVDLKLTYNDKYTYTLSDIEFKKDPKNKNKIIFNYKRNFSDNTSDRTYISFFPIYISSVSIGEGKAGDAVARFRLYFTGKNTTNDFFDSEGDRDMSSEHVFYLPYLLGDALHYERLSKALMHLKDIYIKELPRDPFVN